MEKVIKLSKPVLIDGKEVKELKYDIDEVTPELFAEAEGLKNKATTKVRMQGGMAGAMELDYSFHLYLGAACVVAVNPGVTFEDVLRVKGLDIKKIAEVGRSFLTASGESTEDNSEEPSEITSDAFTIMHQKSEDDHCETSF